MVSKENNNKTNLKTKLPDTSKFFEWRVPGMRILKTCLAVFICLLLTLIRDDLDDLVLQACIAIIVVLKTDFENTWLTGLYRGIASVIGAVMGFLALQFNIYVGLTGKSLGRLLVIILFLFLTIWLTVLFKVPDSTVFSAITFLLIALSYSTDPKAALEISVMRFVAIVLGIVIAIVVNEALPPYRKNKLKQD